MDIQKAVGEQDSEGILKNSCDFLGTESKKIKEECSEKKSSLSLKSKKSSNIISSLIRKTRRKKNGNSKSIDNLVQNLNFIHSASSLGLHTEEEELDLNVDNYEKHFEINGEDVRPKRLCGTDFEKCLHLVDSENSVPSTIKNKRLFFKNLLRKHSCNDVIKKDEAQLNETGSGTKSASKVQQASEIVVETIQKNEIQQTGIANGIPTSYIPFRISSLTPTLESSLQEVQDLANRLQDSENHLIRILTAFITDSSLQKHLIEILFQHSKLQWETERRTSALTNEMWVQQVDIGHTQERILQGTLTSLVKQNRQLQNENEILFRKYEKNLRKIKNMSSDTSNNQKCLDCDIQIERILKHNEELQFKLEAYHREMENLEKELHMLQKHNENIESHLKHSSSHVQNMKAMAARSKMGYELEIVSLNNEVQRNEKIIKEMIEAGTLFMKDFETVRKQLKHLPLAINWTKFSSKENEMTDMINLSRSILNEFSKEIMSLHSELCLKDKDFQSLQQKNSKLQENLQKTLMNSNTELNRQDQGTSGNIGNFPLDYTHINSQGDFEIFHETLEKVKQKYESEKAKLLRIISEYEKADSEASHKDKMIEQTKLFISNITSENIALRSQIDGLNKILTETGAGDMVKELSLSQDQLYFYKTQYYHLFNEKQILLEKLTELENERKEILTREETNYGLFQKQIADLEKSHKACKLLRQEYETEHQTVLSLQNERMKYLEEKSVLKSIFNHMKAELSRIRKLEGTVIDISKEANKLALVAEYNQKLGSKLKHELHEKDKTILQLKTSVEKLNDIQLQHTKDKLSLCYEISEICQIKDYLTEVLSVEVQKNHALGDSKKAIVQSASSRIRKFEELQKNDRSALKSLIKDLKSVVAVKNSLIKENEQLKKEVAEIKSKESDLIKQIDVLVLNKNEQDMSLMNLKSSNMADKGLLKQLEEKLAKETHKYNSDLNQLKTLIVQLRREKEELDNSVKYLQNNTQKLHCDLNTVRRTEKELHDRMKKCILEKQDAEIECNSVRKNLEESNAEKEKLIAEINHLNTISEKMLYSLETNMKATIENEDLYKRELDDSRTLIINLTQDSESLRTIIKEKEMKIMDLEQECSRLRENEQLYGEVVKSKEVLEVELGEMKRKNSQLEAETQESQNAYLNMKAVLEQTENALMHHQNQLRAVLEQKEMDFNSYQLKLEETNNKNQSLLDDYKMETNNLKLQVNDLSNRLDNEKNSYATLAQIHKEMSAKFMKSIKDTVDVKNARQEALDKLQIFEEDIQNLTSEKSDLQGQVTMLLDAMNESKNRINTLSEEKETLKNSLENLQKRYNEILKKCLSLENKILGSELQTDHSEYEKMKQQILQFQSEIQDNQNLLASLRNDIANLEHQISTHELCKSELTLRLHELQRKFETEQSLCQQMKTAHRLILATVLQLREEGKMDFSDSNNLVQMVQNATNYPPEEYQYPCILTDV